MARTSIPIETITRSGLRITAGDANEITPDTVDGAKFQNDGQTILYIRNSGASAHNATIVTPQTVAGLAVSDLVVNVPAGDTILIGPFPMNVFNQPSGADAGFVYVDADGTQTEMRYRALRL